MKKESKFLIALISLLALLANGVNSLAQEGRESRKTATQAEIKGNLKTAQGEFKGELKLTQNQKKTPVDGTFKLLDAKFAFGKVLKGAPYSATTTTEMIQKLGDGNQIIRKNESKVYRDSEGRTRLDQTLETIGKWNAAGEAQQRILINDPVAGFTYVLDPRTRTAQKRQIRANMSELDEEKLKATLQQNAKLDRGLEEHRAKLLANLDEEKAKLATAPPEERARLEAVLQERKAKLEAELQGQKQKLAAELHDRNAKFEAELNDRNAKIKAELNDRNAKLRAEMEDQKAKLEAEKVARDAREDVSSDGRRKTYSLSSQALGKQVIEGVEAEGTRSTFTIPAGEIGNTLPIQVVDERWYSPELQVTIMTKHSDPRTGENTYRLTNINRNEPDRSLFEVPPDYNIIGDVKQGLEKTPPEIRKRGRE